MVYLMWLLTLLLSGNLTWGTVCYLPYLTGEFLYLWTLIFSVLLNTVCLLHLRCNTRLSCLYPLLLFLWYIINRDDYTWQSNTIIIYYKLAITLGYILCMIILNICITKACALVFNVGLVTVLFLNLTFLCLNLYYVSSTNSVLLSVIVFYIFICICPLMQFYMQNDS